MNLSVTSYQNTSNFPFSVSHICHRLVDLVKEPEGTGFTDYNHIQLLVKSKYWSADKRAQWKWDRTILSFLFLIHQTRLRICSSPKCLVKYNIQESPQRTWSHTTLHWVCCKGLPWLLAASWWVASLFSTGAHVSRCSQVCSTLRGNYSLPIACRCRLAPASLHCKHPHIHLPFRIQTELVWETSNFEWSICTIWSSNPRSFNKLLIFSIWPINR